MQNTYPAHLGTKLDLNGEEKAECVSKRCYRVPAMASWLGTADLHNPVNVSLPKLRILQPPILIHA